jgi:hypothetical protein
MLRSTITSLLLLDGPPNPDRFRQVLERSLDRIPRLRQHVVLDPLGAAPPRWERDPLFDLSYHYRRIRTAGKGSLRELLDMAAVIAMQAFDKDRPLWELYVVDGLEDGRSALILKLHHSITAASAGADDELPGRAHAGGAAARPRRRSLRRAGRRRRVRGAMRAIRHRAGENPDRLAPRVGFRAGPASVAGAAGGRAGLGGVASCAAC